MTDEPLFTDPDRAFFGRRKGKALRKHQSELVDVLLPHLAIDPAAPLLKMHEGAHQRILEIGFGGGEHLIREALAHPHAAFIGVEPFVNGMAKALAEIERKNIGNVSLHFGDAADVLDGFAPEALDIVYLLYPDPWPKTRHHKRRFIQDWTLAKIAKILKKGGEFRFATDIPDYAAWTLAHVLRSPDFTFAARRASDWKEPWEGWQSTRYELKALREGRTPCYLTFSRTAD